MPAAQRRSTLAVLFSETMAGVALVGDGSEEEALENGRPLSLRIRIRIPDLERFERYNSTLAEVVAGEVSWDGVLARTPLLLDGQIRVVRDGRIAGISSLSLKVRAIEPDGARLTFIVKRTLDPLGRPYDSTVEIRRGPRLAGRGIVFDPPRGYDQHITDVEIAGASGAAERRRALARFYKAVRAAPRQRATSDEVSELVATLLEFLHMQEDGGPTVDDIHSQYLLMLDRVPEWRRATIVDFLRSNLGALKFFRDATRLLVQNPISHVVNTVGLDAAHNLYQFLYYTLERSSPLIGHTPMTLVGPGRRPRIRRPAVTTLADLDLRRAPEGWVLDGYDVVIVGSGPAGSLLAKRLSRTRKVLVIEKGPAVAEGESRGTENSEFEAYTHLYEGAGLQAANDDWGRLNQEHGSVFILQGACVGGGGMVNNSICVRMSRERIQRWMKGGFPLAAMGAPGERNGYETLQAAYSAVAKEMNIVPLSDAMAPGAPLNPLAARLGMARAHRPSPSAPRSASRGFSELLLAKEGCVGCGFCNVGCAYGAKRSAYEVYLRDALDDPDHDLTLVAGAEVEEIKLTRGGDAVDHLVVRMPHTDHPSTGTRTVRVRAGEYILSAGAVGSSLLLLKSPDVRRLPIGADIGTRFTANISVPLIAVYKDGAIASAPRGLQMTHSYVPKNGEDADGYVVETWSSEPGGFALGVPGYFGDHRAHMKRYPSSATAVVLVGTDPALGSVHWYDPAAPASSDPKLAEYGIRRDTRRGAHLYARPFIVLETRQKDARGQLTDEARRLRDSMRNGLRDLANRMLDGADGRLRYILVPSRHGWKIRTRADVDLVLGAQADLDHEQPLLWPGQLRDIRSLRMTSAHPQGGNPMLDVGGVVGADFRLRGVSNLRVCDASVFPDNAGVNPQWTVLALAHLCAARIDREGQRTPQGT